jgi:hypothetical protein
MLESFAFHQDEQYILRGAQELTEFLVNRQSRKAHCALRSRD